MRWMSLGFPSTTSILKHFPSDRKLSHDFAFWQQRVVSGISVAQRNLRLLS